MSEALFPNPGLRGRLIEALRNWHLKTAVVCEHSQVINYADAADAVLAVLADTGLLDKADHWQRTVERRDDEIPRLRSSLEAAIADMLAANQARDRYRHAWKSARRGRALARAELAATHNTQQPTMTDPAIPAIDLGEPAVTGRGLRTYAQIPTTYGHRVTVRESSAASGPRLWLSIAPGRTGSPDAHLSLPQAMILRAALTRWLTDVAAEEGGAQMLAEAAQKAQAAAREGTR